MRQQPNQTEAALGISCQTVIMKYLIIIVESCLETDRLFSLCPCFANFFINYFLLFIDFGWIIEKPILIEVRTKGQLISE